VNARLRTALLIALTALMCGASSFSAHAQSADDERYNIMRPEPGTHAVKPRHHKRHVEENSQTSKGFGVKEDTRRGSSGLVAPAPLPGPQAPLAVPHQQAVTPPATVPPPLYVPQTGRALPNLPNPAPSGPHGQETFQDRAARCAHQAGAYGQAAGNTTVYINSCINQ
jgi:hypothetical protein